MYGIERQCILLLIVYEFELFICKINNELHKLTICYESTNFRLNFCHECQKCGFIKRTLPVNSVNVAIVKAPLTVGRGVQKER